MKFLALIPFFLFSLLINAQEDGYFLVELEPRSPEVEDMVRAFEGTSVVPIMAANLEGKQVSVLDQRGKTVLLWFWNLECDRCLQEISNLNTLQSEHKNLKIISYVSNTKEEMVRFAAENPLHFEVIPNAGIISEGPYSGKLGYPKMFIVDDEQIIKWVFPSKDFLSEKFDLYKIVTTLYLQLNP